MQKLTLDLRFKRIHCGKQRFIPFLHRAFADIRFHDLIGLYLDANFGYYNILNVIQLNHNTLQFIRLHRLSINADERKVLITAAHSCPRFQTLDMRNWTLALV